MKKSILVKTNVEFKNVNKLQDYGFETEGSLIPFGKDFYQNLSINKRNLKDALELLLLSGTEIYFNMKLERTFKFSNQSYEATLDIEIDNQVVSIHLLCGSNKQNLEVLKRKLFVLGKTEFQYF